MPMPTVFYLIDYGPPAWVRNNAWEIISAVVAIALLTLVKFWTAGRSNPSENKLHGKVVIMTGGTSGVGSQLAHQLAERGAQLVLLTQTPESDPFLVEYIKDMRETTNNQLIYHEQVDLASLHSIRQFATKWIDNAPPRRLDMIVLCAAAITPPGGKRRETKEGIEETWMVNYLANFHLLSILSPALRAQQFDRDVRIIMASCSSYIGSPSLDGALDKKSWSPGAAYARSKFALAVFGKAFQKHLDSYKRPDQLPMNSRVIFVDPGFCRTPGTRRWITRGSLWGLLLYLTNYVTMWFLLKSPYQGAQSFLYAAMESGLGRGEGGKLIKECMEVDFSRTEVHDDDVAKKLWQDSEALIERVEKEQAKKRALKKTQDEKADKEKKDAQAKEEMAGLVDAIKKGKGKKGNNNNEGKSKKKSK